MIGYELPECLADINTATTTKCNRNAIAMQIS